MNKNEFTFLSSNGETQIHAIEWMPDGEPAAVLQISHGMVEYVGRYEAFASFLTDNGFYVVGNDHLGHGASVSENVEHGFFGEPDGNLYVVNDIHKLRELTTEKYPDIPYFMLGHSMGSFLLRQYITEHGEGLAGAIIMGTGQQPTTVLRAGKAMCRVIAASKGWHHRSNMVTAVAFGNYNKSFDSDETGYEWLTRDKTILDKYAADPLCNFKFTLNAYYQMFSGIDKAEDPENVARIPKELPLFLVSGDMDPVGENGKGVEAAFDSYKKAGITDVSMKLYPGDRHEILNELDKETVYSDILEWLKSHMPISENA